MEKERKILSKALDSSYFKKLIEHKIPEDYKNNSLSETFRNKGNELFRKQNHEGDIHSDIWFLYCKSVATAENGSKQLAQAYGNRSAILMHMSLYEASILDVDRALSITKDDSLRVKYLLRKTKCLLLLGKPESRTVFKEVQSLLDALDNQSLLKSVEKDIKKINLHFIMPYRPLSPLKDPRTEKFNTLIRQHEMNNFTTVEINCSEKYGRYLTAAKDFEPAEIIYIEEPYTRCPNLSQLQIYCSYCFSVSWASIPCDQCSWSMYCSEDCKKKAWDEYHDIECQVYSLAKEDSKDSFKQLALRALILGLKEFGSIEKLKNELVDFDTYTGFMHNGKIQTEGFKTIYNLSKDISNCVLEKHLNSTLAILKSLAISTKLFGDDFDWKNADSYKKNEQAFFLGSLFLCLSKISQVNGLSMHNSSWDCKNNLKTNECLEAECCLFGSYLAPITTLLNHSCDPNVNTCYSREHRVILYALKPIKKGEQLFKCYTDPFYDENINERQKILSEKFMIQCDCEACQNNWPDGSKLDITLSPKEFMLVKKFADLSLPAILGIKVDYDETSIARYRKAIKKALKKLPYVSSTPHDLINDLQNAFSSIYGLNFGMPDGCAFF